MFPKRVGGHYLFTNPKANHHVGSHSEVAMKIAVSAQGRSFESFDVGGPRAPRVHCFASSLPLIFGKRRNGVHVLL